MGELGAGTPPTSRGEERTGDATGERNAPCESVRRLRGGGEETAGESAVEVLKSKACTSGGGNLLLELERLGEEADRCRW